MRMNCNCAGEPLACKPCKHDDIMASCCLPLGACKQLRTVLYHSGIIIIIMVVVVVGSSLITFPPVAAAAAAASDSNNNHQYVLCTMLISLIT